jgi:PAS domain S-box-containing protein
MNSKYPSEEILGAPVVAADMDLAEQAAFLTAILESSTEYAIVAKDLRGRILAWNEGARQIYGYDPADVVGKANSFILHTPADVASGLAQEILDEARRTGKWEGELVRVRKNQGRFKAYVTITLRRDKLGEPVGYTMISRDLTEAHRIDRHLREFQEYNRSLIESNIDALMITDPHGIITDVNRQMCELTGFEREELIHSPVKGYFTDARRAEDGIRKVLVEGRITNYELTVHSKAEKETVVSYNASTFLAADGAIKGVIASARDITVQKALEEQLHRKNEELQEQNRRVEEANRLKSEFLANMSHELRTPLNGIIGFSELMFNGKVGPMADDHKEYLGDILTGARHLLHLINDILDLAKVESGKVEIHPEHVNLRSLASEVKDLLGTLAAQKNINVDLHVGAGLENVVLDSGKLKQVLYNYLSNALKFTQEGGNVRIRFNPHGKGEFLLEVEDDGIGISKGQIERLFVAFEQLDSGLSKKYAGTGLGLALTKRLVEYQGGTVGVKSREGHGSIFSAVLPFSLQAGGNGADAPATGDSSGQRRVLVIEDDAADREWIVQILSEAGFAVDQAVTGKEATRKCRERLYDAITLDLILPDLGGWGVLREIRNAGLNAETPILAVTVASQKSAIAAFRIHDLLPKPITKIGLLDSLERAGLAAGKKVLIVNDDPRIVRMAELAIRNAGWIPLTATDGESGLDIMDREAPAAVVLDLMMPVMSGYDFLTRMRRLPHGRQVAVFIWTAKNLTAPEKHNLQKRVNKIVPIGEGGTSGLLEELRCHLKEEAKPAGTARS